MKDKSYLHERRRATFSIKLLSHSHERRVLVPEGTIAKRGEGMLMFMPLL
jgi:hypothetical protein